MGLLVPLAITAFFFWFVYLISNNNSWPDFNLQYIEYMGKTKTITLTEDQFNTIVRGVEVLKGYAGKFSKSIDEVLDLLNTIPYNEGR